MKVMSCFKRSMGLSMVVCKVKKMCIRDRVIGIGETILDILFKDSQPTAAVPGGSR